MKVLLVQVVLNWVMTIGSQDEVCWNEFCALMDQLEERMLCICAWFTAALQNFEYRGEYRPIFHTQNSGVASVT